MNIYKLCLIVIIISILLGILAGYANALNGDSYIFDILYADLGFTYGVCAKEILHQDYKQGILGAAIISALKELSDQAYSEGMFGTPDSGHWLMDARGGDVMDVFWCTLGAACVPFVYEIRGWTIKVGVIR